MWLTLAVAAAALWGISYALSEWLYHDISVLTLLTLEFSSVAIVFAILSWFKGNWTHDLAVLSEPRPALFLAICILTLAAAELCINFSISEKNATLSSLIELSYPLFVVLASLIIFKTTNLTLPVLIGGVLVFAGAVTIAAFSH